jgi:hypothetical protein
MTAEPRITGHTSCTDGACWLIGGGGTKILGLSYGCHWQPKKTGLGSHWQTKPLAGSIYQDFVGRHSADKK